MHLFRFVTYCGHVQLRVYMKHMLNGPPKYKSSEGIVEAAMCTHGMSMGSTLRHKQESGGSNIGHGFDTFTLQ